jgi:hypothetical protein
MAWSRLIRFVDDEDNVSFGEPCIERAAELVEKLELGQLHAAELVGDNPLHSQRPGNSFMSSAYWILTPADVPIIRCIGLNYMKHSKLFL